MDDLLKFAVPGNGLGTLSIYLSNVFIDMKPGEEPMQPEGAAAIGRQRSRPAELCLPLGFPGDTLTTLAWKFIQAPRMLVMLMENNNSYRQIYLDGRPLPKDPQPSWFGYSVGKWDGDTLVVETNGFNDKARLGLVGHPRSEAMRMTGCA